MQIVFTAVGYIKLDQFVSKIVLYNLCNKRFKYVKFLKRYIGVHWLTHVSPVTLWLFVGVMVFYLFTGDVGVRLCFCSVGVGLLSYVLAR